MEKRLWYLEKNFNNLTSDEIVFLKCYIDSLSNEKELSIVEKKLIMKLAIKEKCEYYGYPAVDVIFAAISNQEGGHYDSKNNTIVLNENIFNSNVYNTSDKYPFYANQTTELERMLLIANHECEHYFQYYDVKEGTLSLKSFSWLIFSLLKKYTDTGSSEYKLNYSYKEAENYANIRGWYDTGMFLARHKSLKNRSESDGDFIAWLQSSARKNLANQKNTDNKNQIIEDYNIEQLKKIVSLHPSLIEKYPMLSIFFYPKSEGTKYGELKNINLLFNQYLEIENEYGKTKNRDQVEEEKSIYRQFFYYLLGKDASTVERQYSEVLFDLASYDLISLSDIFDIANKPEKQYEKIVEIKCKRIHTFISRLEQITPFDNDELGKEYYGKLSDRLKETLKVYETSKLMYRDSNEKVESFMKVFRNEFSLDDVEYRNPAGKKSAINI